MNIALRLALLFLLLLVFFLPIDGLGPLGSFPVVKLSGLMLFGMTGLFWVMGGDVRGDSRLLLLVLVFVCWVLLSYFWTSMPVNYEHSQAINSQQSLKAYLYLFMVVLLVFQVVRTAFELQLVMLAFILGLSVLCWLALRGYNPNAVNVRYSLQGLDANEMSVMLASGIPMAVFLLYTARHWWLKLTALLFLPLATLAIVITGSRTGMVVLVLGWCAALPLFWRAGIIVKAMLLVVGALVLAYIAQTIPDKTLERMLSTGTELSQGTLSDRSITWRNAYTIWQEQPIVGYGIGSFRRVINPNNIDYTAHNSFVSITVEQGLIGLLCYLAVIAYLLSLLFKSLSGRHFIMLLLLLVPLSGQMTLTLHEDMYVWLIYSLVVLVVGIYAPQPQLPLSSATRGVFP